MIDNVDEEATFTGKDVKQFLDACLSYENVQKQYNLDDAATFAMLKPLLDVMSSKGSGTTESA
jgi:hypothetical protein